VVEHRDADLTGSRFRNVDLSGSRLRSAFLRDVVFTDSWIEDVRIEGHIASLVVNGLDVTDLVEAELDRRHPERLHLRPDDVDAVRRAWSEAITRADETVARARRLPPDLLDVRVDDEFSFIQTLRHLVFATDSWVRRAMLGDPWPYDALGLPFDEMDEIEGMPNDIEARPSLDEVLALHDDRLAVVREQIENLTEERLAGMTGPTPGPGYPASQSYEVRRCLVACLIEEWEHRRYIERDLAVLASHAG
jgi:DinB superfamily/Pentapeptide repeats (8 copies)